jgi:hypothetical protein
MNLPAPSTATNARRDRQSEGVSARQRSILLFARIACAVVAASGIGLFAATLHTYIDYLYRPCVPATCIYGQLSAGSTLGLRGLGLSLSAYVVLNATLVIITGILCTAVAPLLLWRKSDSWIAILIAFLLVVLGATDTIISPPILQPLLGAGAAALIANFSNFLGAISLPLLFSLLPNGRFVPRWTRWLVIVFIVPSITLTILPPLMAVPAVVPILSEIFFSVSGLGLIGAQIYRYRRVSTPVERQQTKWVIFGFSLVALMALSLTAPESILSQSGQPYSSYMIVGLLAGSSIGIPIALCFGIAILRSHLYDIDVLINRTLVYGSLSAILALIYFGSVIGLQALVSTITGHFSIASQSPLVLVASTLVIAALFQPLRRRLQQVIDRRFFRRKYDAARTLAAFSAMLRHEVDLGELHDQLLTVVEETMQPTHISLWLRTSIKTEDDSL